MLCWIKLAFKQIQMSLSYTPQYSNAFDTMYAFDRITLFLTCKLRYMKAKQKSCKPKLYLSGGGGTTICNLCNKGHKGNVHVFSTNASENYIYIIYLAAIETRFPYERAFFKEHCWLISLFRGMAQKSPEQFDTLISGRLWKKHLSNSKSFSFRTEHNILNSSGLMMDFHRKLALFWPFSSDSGTTQLHL